MISFVTLLLGIAFGVRSIEVQAAPAVASVEFRLDGRTLTVLPAPPWRVPVDFGAPAPHELVAVARNGEGAEIGRAVQRINIPRSMAEATLTLLPGTGGRGRVARLAWASALSVKPERVELTMDGRPLESVDLERIALPNFRPANVHVLRAVLDFKQGTQATAELLVGGVKRESSNGPETMRGETKAELTAVPVVFKGRPPKDSEMEGWFLADGQPVRVEAVEESPGEIVVVKDERAGPWITQLDVDVADSLRAPGASTGGDFRGSFRGSLALLRKGQRLRFCWPGTLPPKDAAPGYDVFLRSPDYAAPLNILRLLANVEAPEFQGPSRLADAVAVAALSAAAGNCPRAVLVLVAGPDDESGMTVDSVRGYLRALRVPLFVWAKNKKIASSWGKAEVPRNVGELEGAATRLTAAVERQRIVWLEGSHLPQSISISPKARGATLVE
jgi:hypothetical protein